MSDENDERLDLSAWDAEAPPADFAARVMDRIREEEAAAPKKREVRRSWRGWPSVAGGAAAALALAAAIALRVGGPPAHGEAIAKERIEVAIGERGKAVLEPGAEVKWDGDEVVQSRGNVFYRVEPGAKFRVHTPAADVEVKGTCFEVKVAEMQKRDVKSGAVGAVLSALAFVGVYEGKVAVSHASEHVDLVAGESARVTEGGIAKSGDLAEGDKAFAAAVEAGATSGDDPYAKANENLVGQISSYKAKIEAIAGQKKELEAKLAKTEKRLAEQSDGGKARERSDWELDKDDWKQLAKDGTVKFRMPCPKEYFSVSDETLGKVGLAPSDLPAVKEAYAKTNERLWAQIKPLCQQALGISGDVVDKIGLSTCPHLIHDVAIANDREAAAEAMTEVAEMRAGLRPEPGPNEKVNPVMREFLVLTTSQDMLEAELAKSFGPEQAHRYMYQEDSSMCMGQSTWGGGKKR